VATRLIRSAAFLLCLVGPAASGAAQTVTDQRVWVALVLQGHVAADSPWRWSLEAFARSRDGVENLDSAAVRPILTYVFSPHSSVGGGYARGQSFPSSGGAVREQRAFGPYIWTGSAAGVSVTLRTRLESRFIEDNSGPLVRLRQQFRFTRPLKKGSRTSWVGYDEILVHLNTTTRSPRGVDQNRVFAGISHAMTNAARVEAGYLNQFIPGHGGRDRMNHVLSGSLSVSF
jgi:hypothetical protein